MSTTTIPRKTKVTKRTMVTNLKVGQTIVVVDPEGDATLETIQAITLSPTWGDIHLDTTWQFSGSDTVGNMTHTMRWNDFVTVV